LAKRSYPKRYAQAVFEIAREKKELDGWQAALDSIARLSADGGFVTLMESPRLRFDDKSRLLAEVLGDVKPLALNLAYLLVKKGILAMAGEIAEDYRRLLDNYRGIEKAEVVTAVPLTKEDKRKLEKRLGAAVGKKVIIEARVDAGVVGGVIARVGGKLLDGSTRHRLELLKGEIGGAAR